MALTKRTRKTVPTAATARHANAPGPRMADGQRRPYALIAALALSLATAIGAAAWLIATQEVSVMSATTTADAYAATANAPTPTPASAATATTAATTAAANDSATLAATATADTTTAAGAQPSTNQPVARTTQQSAASSAASAPPAPSAAGQRAFIDPVTGEFRQPEHDEIAALNAAAAAAAPARRAARTANAAAEFFVEDGSIAAVVPEDLHTFTVATRGADGRIVIEHTQGAKNADRMVKANSAKKPRASVSQAQKEDRNDR